MINVLRSRWLNCFVLLALSLTPLGAHAAERPIDRFVTTVQINPDASLDVVEMITFKDIPPVARMEQLKMVRKLPRHYTSKGGQVFNTEVSVKDIVDATQSPVAFDVKTNADHTEVTFAADSRPHQVYRFHYELRGALEFAGKQPVMSWYVLGNDWPGAIHDVEGLVYLPENMDLVKVEPGGYRGDGFDKKAETFKAADGIAIRAFDLAPHEALHFDIVMPEGVISKPDPKQKVVRSLQDKFVDLVGLLKLLVIPGVVAGILYLFIWRVKAEESVPYSSWPEWKPTAGITPAEAALLLENKCTTTVPIATIFDLAARGYLLIAKPGAELSACEIRQGENLDLSNLKAHERMLTESLFKGTASVSFETVRQNLATLSAQMSPALYSELNTKHFINTTTTADSGTASTMGSAHQPANEQSSALSQVSMIWAGVLCLAGGVAVFLQHFEIGGGLIVGGLLVAATANRMPAKSLAGARAAADIQHFKEYCERLQPSDVEELLKSDARVFEKLLPYSFVAGATHCWSQKLEPASQADITWILESDGEKVRPRHAVELIDYLAKGQ